MRKTKIKSKLPKRAKMYYCIRVPHVVANDREVLCGTTDHPDRYTFNSIIDAGYDTNLLPVCEKCWEIANEG